jgi:hypothetical protein
MPFVITYDCTDKAGNKATTMRRRVYVGNPCAGKAEDGSDERLCPSDDPSVVVCSSNQLCPLATAETEASDKKAPSLVLKGPTSVTINAGDPYLACTALSTVDSVCERGGTATDELDGNIDAMVLACSPDGVSFKFKQVGVRGCELQGSLDTRKGGVYTLQFMVTNSAGLSAYANRTVTVISNCPDGESLCLDGISCSEDGVCAADLAAATLEAENTGPPATSITLLSNSYYPQFVSLARFTPLGVCDEGTMPSSSFLCEPGCNATGSSGANLRRKVLSCPPEVCMKEGCPGHEFETKGLNGCLNTSAPVGTTFDIRFVVFDDVNMEHYVTKTRSITIGEPCDAGMQLCVGSGGFNVCTELPCEQVEASAEVPDVDPPVLTLKAWTLVLDYGTDYPDLDISPCASAAATDGCWAWATDAIDGDVSSSMTVQEVTAGSGGCAVGAISGGLCAPGDYRYRYTATDAAGNRLSDDLVVSIVQRVSVNLQRTVPATSTTYYNVDRVESQAMLTDPAESLTLRTSVAASLNAVLGYGEDARWAIVADDVSVMAVDLRTEAQVEGSEMDGQPPTWYMLISMSVSYIIESQSSAGQTPAARRLARELLQTALDSDPITNVTLTIADQLATLGFESVETQPETPTFDPATAHAAVVLSALEDMKRTYSTISVKLGDASLRIIESVGLYGIKQDDVTLLWSSALGSAQANLVEFRENLEEVEANIGQIMANADALTAATNAGLDSLNQMSNSLAALEGSVNALGGALAPPAATGIESPEWEASCLMYSKDDEAKFYADVSYDVFLKQVVEVSGIDPGNLVQRRRHLLRGSGGGSGTKVRTEETEEIEVHIEEERGDLVDEFFSDLRESDFRSRSAVGYRNPVMGGMMVSSSRVDGDISVSKRFGNLRKRSLYKWTPGTGWGVDPVFVWSSDIYDEDLELSDYYNTSDKKMFSERLPGVTTPNPFQPESSSHTAELFFDSNLVLAHAYRYVEYAELGYYLDPLTSAITVTLVTLNEDLGTSTLTTVEFTRPLGQSLYEVEVKCILVPHVTWDTFKDPYEALWFAIYIAWVLAACIMLANSVHLMRKDMRAGVLEYSSLVLPCSCVLQLVGMSLFVYDWAVQLSNGMYLSGMYDVYKNPFSKAHLTDLKRNDQGVPEEYNRIMEDHARFVQFCFLNNVFWTLQIVVYVYMIIHYLLLLDFQPHLGTVSRALWRARGELTLIVFVSCLSTVAACYSMLFVFDIGEVPALTTTSNDFSYFFMTGAVFLEPDHGGDPNGTTLKLLLGLFYITSCIVILGFVFAIVDDNFLKTKRAAAAVTHDMPLYQMIKFLQSTVMTTVRFYPPELPLMMCLQTYEEGHEVKEEEEVWFGGHEAASGKLAEDGSEVKESRSKPLAAPLEKNKKILTANGAARMMRQMLKAKALETQRLTQLERTKAIVKALKDNAYGERKRLGGKLIEERRRMREEGHKQRRVSAKMGRMQQMLKNAAKTAAHYADAVKDAVLGDSDDEMTREESLLARQKLADDCTALLLRDGMDEMVHLMVRPGFASWGYVQGSLLSIIVSEELS